MGATWFLVGLKFGSWRGNCIKPYWNWKETAGAHLLVSRQICRNSLWRTDWKGPNPTRMIPIWWTEVSTNSWGGTPCTLQADKENVLRFQTNQSSTNTSDCHQPTITKRIWVTDKMNAFFYFHKAGGSRYSVILKSGSHCKNVGNHWSRWIGKWKTECKFRLKIHTIKKARGLGEFLFWDTCYTYSKSRSSVFIHIFY